LLSASSCQWSSFQEDVDFLSNLCGVLEQGANLREAEDGQEGDDPPRGVGDGRAEFAT
jgi:hypothetical protein